MTGCYVGCTPPTLPPGEHFSSPTTTLPLHLTGQLPFTGGDVLGLLLLGVAVITIGIAFLRFHR